MKTIDYFKLQAKNLHRDFKTQKTNHNLKSGVNFYEYDPKYFDIPELIDDFRINEDNFSLMSAQHIIARLAGFAKWTDISKASTLRLELSKLLFDNMDRVDITEWEKYISNIEIQNTNPLDDEIKLEIFKKAFLEVEQDVFYSDYRLEHQDEPILEKEPKQNHTSEIAPKISSLPLNNNNRKEFIKTANEKLEELLEMMEPRHPQLIRKLWNPEQWINKVITPDKLPIDRDYALSLVTAFLLHHFNELDDEANKQGLSLN